ncbi:hypothetical protein AC249_AIPGENE4220 [Exaiptasia diaphana]|nr:hypothetical protein AC249_AIPGENE4220 [Exaiptasia diaphana]
MAARTFCCTKKSLKYSIFFHRPGRGGNADRLLYSVRKIEGHISLLTCPGKGGQAAKNGRGGPGGRGGLGGRVIGKGANSPTCEGDGTYGRGDRGYTAKVKAGTRGEVGARNLQGKPFDDSRKKYPLFLIRLMMRVAEDRVWAVEAKAILDFVVNVTKGRDNASKIRKFAKRRIAFLNKNDFDRFGINKLFAPLMAWEAYKKQVKDIKDSAKDYETAYNGLRASIEREEGIKQIIKAMPESAKVQVKKQRERLIEVKRVAVSEKGGYVTVCHLFC